MQLNIGEESYPFDPEQLRNDEADALERTLGYSFTEFGKRLRGGYTSAVTAYVWVMRRREDPKVRMSDVRFTVGDISIGYSDDEARRALAAQEDDEDGTAEENRARFLASLPDDQRARVEAEVTADPLDSTDLAQPEPDSVPAT